MKVFCLNDAGNLDKMIVYLTDKTMFVSCFNEILYIPCHFNRLQNL